MIDVSSPDLTLGVVGSGLMGRGIAQVALQAGIRVHLFDSRTEALGQAQEAIAQGLHRLATREPLDVTATLARLHLADGLPALADCDIVIEAIIESLPAKQALFAELEAIVAPDTVLATNTSSLLVTEVAAQCARPGRLAGLHFFSPVPRMKIAEVIAGERTEAWATDVLHALTERVGHRPVRARDTPGFIVNHAGRAYGPESLRIASEQVADVVTLDRVLREACGFRMGPFELFDLTGLDISHPAGESIYRQFFDEPRFRPSPITRLRLAGGLLGRKSGQGFYTYDEQGRRLDPPEPEMPPAEHGTVWLAPCEVAGVRDRVAALLAGGGASVETGSTPSASAVCIVLPVGDDATCACVTAGLDPCRTAALDPLFLEHRRTLMLTPVTTPAARDRARAWLGSDGTPVSVVRDSPGFVAQRVCAAIVNVACDMAQQGIASPADIDQAVRLGLAYPKGPFALGDALGASVVLQILHALHARYQDPRYRPSPWLSRRAALGVPLATPEPAIA